MRKGSRRASARSSAALGIGVLCDLGRGGGAAAPTGTRGPGAEATHSSRCNAARSGLADGDRVRRRGAATTRRGGVDALHLAGDGQALAAVPPLPDPGQLRGEVRSTALDHRGRQVAARGSGLSVTSVARDGLIIDFQAPASRVETAFRTGLERYRLANGSIGQARTAPVQVPATIAKYVTVGRRSRHDHGASALRRTPRAQVGAGHLPRREGGRESSPIRRARPRLAPPRRTRPSRSAA